MWCFSHGKLGYFEGSCVWASIRSIELKFEVTVLPEISDRNRRSLTYQSILTTSLHEECMQLSAAMLLPLHQLFSSTHMSSIGPRASSRVQKIK